MNRAVAASAAAALIAAVGAAFVVAGPQLRPAVRAIAMIGSAAAEEGRAPIYFQDPNGKPSYSLVPRKTPDGRDYRAVPAGADVGFDDDASSVTPATAAAGGSAERRIKYYRNPMGLPDTSLTPKKDSMGMDYVPVYEGDDSDDGSVKLSPGKIQRTGVKSEPASKRVIRAAVRAPGTIALDERRISVIAMRSESFVLYLATISSKTTGGDQAYGRGSRQRLMNLDVPDAAILAIEKSRTVPTSIEWTSPRDGIVLERSAIEGMRAQPGGVLFRIADHSIVWALIDVAERDLGAIAKGQPATVRARSFPEREFSGTVEVIYPEINKETRTARVRVELQNPDLILLHDMYVGAEIDTGTGDAVLCVPESAVMDTGSRQAVFVDKGQGRLEPREIKLGHRGAGYVEVRQGLADGDPVVLSANFLIDAESNLKAALKGFAEGVQQ